VFRVRLLLTPATPHDAGSGERAILGYKGPRKTVLVVDDDGAHLDFIEQVLGPLGFTVFVALSGQESLEVAARCHPDLVLLDLTMPGMTGWEVAARLRASQHDELAILVVSADAHVLQGGRQGPVHHDDYLVKPLQLPELFDKLHLLLDVEWILDSGEAAANLAADEISANG